MQINDVFHVDGEPWTVKSITFANRVAWVLLQNSTGDNWRIQRPNLEAIAQAELCNAHSVLTVFSNGRLEDYPQLDVHLCHRCAAVARATVQGQLSIVPSYHCTSPCNDPEHVERS